MAKIQAYSSVVVTDYSDVGQLNLYLTSNQPTTVVYDPNQNMYTPNWSNSSLVITPVISFNGADVSVTASGVSVEFTRQEGSGAATALTSGEIVSGNKLTVSANKLANVSSKLLTYICKLTYTDPNTNVALTSQATLTYTLLSNASEVKFASISGETAFLYDTTRKLVGNDTIILTADLTNVSVSQWQYKKSDGSFEAFPTTNNTTINGTTLKVVDSEPNIWINDKTAVIKLVTSDNGAYDLHTIVKIYDGAAGTDTVSAVLSNENHVVPVDSTGEIKSLDGASTTITVYEGGENVTKDWTITVKLEGGLTGDYNSSSYTFTPTALTSDTGYADFTCKKDGHADIIKRYTIAKQYAGADGQDAIIYEVVPNYYTLNLDENDEFSPSSVTFNAYTKIGSSMTKSNYSGRFIIAESTDSISFTTKYTSGSDESTKSYSPSSNLVKAIKCSLYKSGGTDIQLDEQTVIITKDGKTGQDGENGKGGTSVVVGNDSEVIPCTTAGLTASAKDISIPFYGYIGIERAPITCAVGTLPSGMTVKSNTAGTKDAGGLLVLNVSSGSDLGKLDNGDITLTFTCNETSVEKKFTWTKNKQAANGMNAVIFQLYSMDGGTIYNGEGTTTINSMMMSGPDTVTPTSYSWAKYEAGTGYVDIDGQNSNSLTVIPDMVDATSWFRCIAKYDGKDYTAYWTVVDKSDPVMAYTYSTVGEFKNSQGEGAIYTRVYRNGVELDPIKTLVFSTTAPTNANNGDYYYHLNKTNKTCTLKKYNGTQWVDANEKDEYSYEYYRIDSNGVERDTTQAFKTDRCFYIDPSIIEGQMQFRCKVTG